jgi:hypothetical protein
MASVAGLEAGFISDRTKKALKADRWGLRLREIAEPNVHTAVQQAR